MMVISLNNSDVLLIYKQIDENSILIKHIELSFLKYVALMLLDKSFKLIITDDKKILLWLSLLDFTPITCDSVMKNKYDSSKIWIYEDK